ncbi:MAG: GNAT family N-acetyltransferase [Ignavibacteriae bacterium]|nr:GNAT family N-acetyltransferase [Ignavibacteriota bacterium]
MSLTVEIIDNAEDMRPLEAEWNVIAAQFKTPLLRYEWFTACVEAFCPPGKPKIIVVKDGTKVTGIAPLVLRPSFGIRRLQILGAAVLGEPTGFLYADELSLEYLAKAILSFRKPLLLSRLPTGSPELQSMDLSTKKRWRYSQRYVNETPWISISTSWDKYYSSISSSWRSAFRRSQRKAESLGKVEFEVVSPDTAHVQHHLDEVFRVEAAGWKQRVGTALQTYQALRRFFEIYSQATARLGILRIALMRINGKVVSVQLLVENSRRLWILKIGYDEAYAHCSPGILLMNNVIQYAFEKRLEGFEFLGGNEAWIRIWPHDVHRLESYRLYPLSPMALLSHGLEVSASSLKKIHAVKEKHCKKHAWKALASKAMARFKPSGTL